MSPKTKWSEKGQSRSTVTPGPPARFVNNPWQRTRSTSRQSCLHSVFRTSSAELSRTVSNRTRQIFRCQGIQDARSNAALHDVFALSRLSFSMVHRRGSLLACWILLPPVARRTTRRLNSYNTADRWVPDHRRIRAPNARRTRCMRQLCGPCPSWRLAWSGRFRAQSAPKNSASPFRNQISYPR